MASSFREWMFRAWYGYVNNVDKKAEILFMNYGYDSSDLSLPLDSADEPNRYSIQLYHHLLSHAEINQKDIIEIGCGRGGGLAYGARKFTPATAVGIDLDKTAASFCNKQYARNGLSFQQGDAQNLSFADSSFDVVLNVESSHRYPDMKAFLSEVKRVLRPQGYFLITDFRYDYEMDEMNALIAGSGMKLVKQELITKNVVAALEKDDERKRSLVKKLAPFFLRSVALNFAGTIGSKTYNQFAQREYEYFVYILQKVN